MAVKTKSIYEPGSPDDGIRVLVTRFYPRGVKKDRFDRWEREASPSRALLKTYRAGDIGWSQFRVSFLREMKSERAAKALDELSSLARTKDVTLLCYEREGERCHRQLVKELLGKKSNPSSRLPVAPPDTFYPRKKSGRKAST